MLGTRAPRELTSSVNVVSTSEAGSCPEMCTATVIGILFSRRSIAKFCAIISLSVASAVATLRHGLQAGRDARQRAHPLRPAFHAVERTVRGFKKRVN